MGNREDLLAGAKRCLLEKGYARTTARDIATAAGTSLAAIGYHFKSREALLNAALYEAVDEWGAELGTALVDSADPEAPLDRFEAIWARVIDSFPAHRPLWATQFELAARPDPEMREFLASAQVAARRELAALFLRKEPTAAEARELGAFYQALLAGVMVQYLLDPEHAPTAAELTNALRQLVEREK